MLERPVSNITRLTELCSQFTKSNLCTSLWVQLHCVPTCRWCTVFPTDAVSGEDPNNSPESVWSWWHRAVSRGSEQDRLLQSTSEITAATITNSCWQESPSPVFGVSPFTQIKPFVLVFLTTRAMVHYPSAWLRPTCPCPTCLTKRAHPLHSFCQSETFEQALGRVSFTHLWER